jgi:antitoxin (DNA-binding transcriptional repressor) of toxin-antitoxin stability system
MTHKLKLEESPELIKTLIDELRHGGSVDVTENSKLVAKFVLVNGTQSKKRKAGFGIGLIKAVSDDFEAPLEDFKDYM